MPSKPRSAPAMGAPQIPTGLLAGGFRKLAQLTDVSDRAELKRELALRLDRIWELAEGRARTVGRDQHEVKDPDGNTLIKVIEAASELLDVRAGRGPTGPVDMSVFASEVAA